jgi:pSer/pThr/pTyr-binding forkhead associated (FHA) protein
MLAGGLVVGGSGKGYTLPAMGRYGHFSAVEGLPTGLAMLVVKRGPNAGARFLLDRPITSAGRHSSSDIILDDATVSDRQAAFRWENDELHVVDVGSPYGTYVNRELVESATLANGDKIYIGIVCLVVFKSRND